MEQMTLLYGNKKVKIAIVLNLIIPIVYVSLIIILKIKTLSMTSKDNIYYNGMIFWLTQLIFLVVGWVLCKKKKERKIAALLITFFILFFLTELLTIDMFSPWI
jgi:cytochrome c biogenesis factor